MLNFKPLQRIIHRMVYFRQGNSSLTEPNVRPYNPGMVKLKDVAAAAGVSQATASLVLNNRPGVNAQTRARVLAIAKRLGYAPNPLARNLATRRSHTIGLVVTDIENPFFAALTRHLDVYVKEHGYGLILSLSSDDVVKQNQIVEDFVGKMVEGVLIVPALHDIGRRFHAFKKLDASGVPYVFVSSYYPGFPADCAMADLTRGSCDMANHLLDCGHRDIVFLSVEDDTVIPAATRIDGFRQALSDRSLTFSDRMIVRARHPDYQSGLDATRLLLGQRKPDAIMAMNDILALGAVRAIVDRGYRIPADIAVAGYDNVIYSSISQVPLTTVYQDLDRMSHDAVDMLFRRISGDRSDHPLLQLVRPELVVRESTGGRNTLTV